MKRTIFILLAFFAISILSVSCGYHLLNSGRYCSLPYKSISIPIVKSPSSDLLFESEFTEVLRSEFLRYSNIRLLGSKRADVILNVQIQKIQLAPVGYRIRRYNTPRSQYLYETTSGRLLKIILYMALTERKSKRVIWEKGSISETAYLYMGDDPLENSEELRKALIEIASRIARRAYQLTLERF